MGALDGTHISAHPPTSDQTCHCNSKGGVLQNVPQPHTFDMHFCYILKWLEGSASDGRTFMMHVFMTWSFHQGSITLQMQAIPSVMLSWCHSVVLVSSLGVGKQWFVVCNVHDLIFYTLSDLLDRPIIMRSSTI